MIFPTHIVAVGAMVTNDKGEILLVKNPHRGWEFPGGQVENGESLIEGLEREIFEESGINTEIGSLVAINSSVNSYMGWDKKSKVNTKVIVDFLAKAVGGQLKTSDESVDVGWFTKDEALNIIEEPNHKDRIKTMINFKGKVLYRVYKSHPYEVISERYV